jgi:hypothetical protein
MEEEIEDKNKPNYITLKPKNDYEKDFIDISGTRSYEHECVCTGRTNAVAWWSWQEVC